VGRTPQSARVPLDPPFEMQRRDESVLIPRPCDRAPEHEVAAVAEDIQSGEYGGR